MVRVILNADDFGKSLGRNRAVDDSFKQGLIESAGLIVTGKHLQNAIDLINKGGYVEKIHLHFNVSTNLLHEDPGDFPLTEAMKKDPLFCKNDTFRPCKKLPHRFWDIMRWKVVYQELVAQYNKFIEVTEGKADYKHVDFHLWYNLTWPVTIALKHFVKNYKIPSVRYIGVHQMDNQRYRLLYRIGRNRHVTEIPATNIDYYLSKRQLFAESPVVELYCHPNYKEDGVFLDDSPSYLQHERQSMLEQMRSLRELDNTEFISWEEFLNLSKSDN